MSYVVKLNICLFTVYPLLLFSFVRIKIVCGRGVSSLKTVICQDISVRHCSMVVVDTWNRHGPLEALVTRDGIKSECDMGHGSFLKSTGRQKDFFNSTERHFCFLST